MDLKSKIEKVLSEILSEKHDAVVKLRFEQKQTDDKTQTIERGETHNE